MAPLVMSVERARSLGYEPLGFIRSYAFVGVEPERMGIGPERSARPEEGRDRSQDVQLFEINEAFAAQYLAVERSWDSTARS
jgi:acetyl-CoA acetyltransferase